jgi:predicted RNA methylase
MTYTASYSPEDDKLRLYASSRLDAETYAQVKAAGFSWAPKQDLFFAIWTPHREDFLTELAGEIGDEDTSLVDRAEQRADRFDGYRENRVLDAQRAHEAVSAIADHIPLGQPILINHHSERHARKDAERITNGMRKTVRMWETASYWQARAAGALHHAEYRERPDVRHRRIKTLGADMRRHERDKQQSAEFFKAWTFIANEAPDKQKALALRIANSGHCNLTMARKEGDRVDLHSPSAYSVLCDDPSPMFAPRTVAEVIDAALAAYPRTVAHAERWIEHYTNRIAYETAMLGESGGLAADGIAFEVGGRVKARYDEWLIILKVNKTGDIVNSVTTTPPRFWGGRKYIATVEEIKEYKAPSESDTAAVKAATKLPPLCNYPGEGFKEMTAAEWKRMGKTSDAAQTRKVEATDTAGAHRIRVTYGLHWKMTTVYLTDAKRVDPPAISPNTAETAEALRAIAIEAKADNPLPATRTVLERDERIPSYEDLNAMKTAAANVTVVVAPQLYATPTSLGVRMVELADIRDGQKVLEPSAGAGALCDAIRAAADVDLTAIEGHSGLATAIAGKAQRVHWADFLEWAVVAPGAGLGFDRVVMNPPFAKNQDIQHVRAAFSLLREGGRLVSVMSAHHTFALDSASTDFREFLDMHNADTIQLDAGTFKESGTGVNAVLVVIDR